MAYYRYIAGKFRQEPHDLKDNWHRSEQFLDIFAEFDFSYIDDGCNYFCPECRNMLQCEAYKDIKDIWESFYM